MNTPGVSKLKIKGVPPIPSFNFTVAALKPICETYAGDESDDPDLNDPNEGLGIPDNMSRTFDMSQNLKAKVPKLDFRKLKHVKETKDWYGYQEKLEKNVRFLRERISTLEKSNLDLNRALGKFKLQNKNLYSLNRKIALSLKQSNKKIEILKDRATNKDFEMTMPNLG